MTDSVSIGKSKSKVEIAPFYNEYHGLFGINLTAEREEHRAWFEAKGAVNKSVANKELNEVRLRVLNNSAIKGALYPPIGPPRIPTREKVMHREGSVILKENPRARTTESQSSILRPTMPGDGIRVTKSGGRGDAVRVAFGSRPGIASSVTKLAKVDEIGPKKERKMKKSTASASNEFGSSNGSYEEDGSINTNNDDLNSELQSDSRIEIESSEQPEPKEKKQPTIPIKPKPPASRAPKSTSSRVKNTRGIPSGNNNQVVKVEKPKDGKPTAITVTNSDKTKGNGSSINTTSPRVTTKPSNNNNGTGNDKNQNNLPPRPHPRKVSTKSPKSSVSIQVGKGEVRDFPHPPSNPEVEIDGNNIKEIGDDKDYYDDASFEEETLPFNVPSVLPPEPSQTSINYSFDEADAEEYAEDNNQTKTVPNHSNNKQGEGSAKKKDLEESGYDDASFEEEPVDSSPRKEAMKTIDPQSPTSMITSNTITVKTDQNNSNNDHKKDLPHNDNVATTPSSPTVKNHRNKALENLSDGNNASTQHNRDNKNKLKENADESYEEDYENDGDFNL